MQKFVVPGSNSETVTAIAEIVPNVLIGKHLHFGIEAGYVLAGDVVLMVAGKPDLAPRLATAIKSRPTPP